MLKQLSILFTLLMFLVACRVSKDMATPQAPLPDHFRNETSTASGTVADIRWNDFFHDPALNELIGHTIEHNYDMQLALQNIEASRLLVKQLKWAYVPDARLLVTGNTSLPSDNSLNGISAKQFLSTTHLEDFSAGVALSWEADIWGKIRNQRAGARAAYLQTEEARKLLQTDLVAPVAEGYYNLLMLDAQLVIARRNEALTDSTLRILRLQYTAGQVTALGVQQAEAQRLTAAALVPELEQNIGLQENALSLLTGELPAAIKRTGTLTGVNLPDSLSAGVPAALVSHRPDVRYAELALTRANAQVGINRANMYPTLSITASGGVNSFKASNWFTLPASLFGLAAGGIVQPLLQRRQLSTAYELAKVEREQAVIRFRQSVLYAVGDVSDALVRIDRLKAEQDIVTERVNTLRQAIANANMLFSSGMATYLEVITAQANVLQGELELASLTRQRLEAKVELYRSLGGGWK